MSQFVQLTKEDCKYLLDLIADMDADTRFTAKQRNYTVPKLQRIMQDAKSARLAFQDVDYLLELIEDDEMPEMEQQREMTRTTLQDIQVLQSAHFDEQKDVEEQRNARRARRNPVNALQGHFETTSVVD